MGVPATPFWVVRHARKMSLENDKGSGGDQSDVTFLYDF